MDNHLTVFTEVGLEKMLDDSGVRGEDLTVPGIDQPAGGMQKRIWHLFVKELVKVLELTKHSPDERWPVLGSLGELPRAEDCEGRNNAKDVEGDYQEGYG